MFRVQKQAELAKKRDAERSEREEMEARLKIDNEERMRRLATFQELASNRMAIQQQHLGPLMVNLKQSHAELTEAENLQVLTLKLQNGGASLTHIVDVSVSNLERQ